MVYEGGPTITCPQGTCMVCEVDDPAIFYDNDTDHVPYGYGRLANHDSRYGGQGYYDRVSNDYIVLSDKVSGDSSGGVIRCRYGDTFIVL